MNFSVYGSHAYFECRGGYSLNGSAQVACSDNGTWNGSIPSCTARGIKFVSLAPCVKYVFSMLQKYNMYDSLQNYKNLKS